MAKPILTEIDFQRAAKKLRCEVASVKAVAEVESRGKGFYASGFPVILFEKHIFRKYTQGRYNKSHPHLSGSAGGYGAAGQNQINKFNEAFGLNPIAAMKACSWGKFQIMGFNHAVCGYEDVGAFVDAMKESEGKQLDAFVEFVIGNGLGLYLRTKNWAAFAKGYNGAGYRKNNYDTKMASAYKRHSGTPTPTAGNAASETSPTDEPTETATSPTIQNADTIVNTGDVGTPTPAPTEVTLNAPQGMGSVQSATKVTVLGITVPPFILVVVETIKGWISDGFLDAKEIGNAVVSLIKGNSKYILIAVGLVVVVIIIKKITRELIFLVTVITHAIPGWNSITVVAPEKVEPTKKWWEFWK
jgi:hypothetical protein